MNQDDLLDTIRRLLALSESPNEHEAALALAKAQEWMQRHKLSMAEVAAAETEADFDEHSIWEGYRAPAEFPFVLRILHDHFFVRVVRVWTGDDPRRVVLFGQRADVPMARHVFFFLVRTFRRLWADYQMQLDWSGARRARGRDRNAFYLGLYRGLNEKLSVPPAAEHDGRALVALDRGLTEASRKHFGKIEANHARKRITGSMEATIAGERQGRSIEIHKPLPGASRPLLGCD